MNEEQMQRQADIMDPQEVLGLMREVEELKADKSQLEIVVNSHANMRDDAQEQLVRVEAELNAERRALAEAIDLINQVMASGELERTSPTLYAKLESCVIYNAQGAHRDEEVRFKSPEALAKALFDHGSIIASRLVADRIFADMRAQLGEEGEL